MRFNIENTDDVKEELRQYFEAMRYLPDINRPICKTTNFQFATPVSPYDDIRLPPDMTAERISRTWFVDEKIMSLLICANEYRFLSDFFSPLPKKEVAYRYHLSRQGMYKWADKLFNRILKTLKNNY